MAKHVKIGKSRFVLGILGAFILGIFLADKIIIPFLWALVIITIIIIAGIIFYNKKIYLLIILSILGLFLGLLYYHFWDWRENKKQLTYNQEITVSGVISQKPIQDTDQKIIINYEKTKILIQTAKYPEFSYGDKIEVKGKIEDPKNIKTIDNFNYGKYLLSFGIRGTIKNPESIKVTGSGGNIVTKNIYLLGDKFESTLNKILSEPYAALEAGIILGTKRNIPDSLMSAFSRDGLTHIVAVSGYNLMIVVSFLGILFASFSRRISFWGSVLFITFFVILTGAPASILRAAVLAILVLWCKILGRRPYYPVLILFTATIMLLFNPYALKNDASFQLSFLAFIGLVAVSGKISNLKLINKLPSLIKTAFSETMGAQILVLPILILNFGLLSFIAPIANVLILPTIPTSMFLGFISGTVGMLFLPLGRLIGILVYLVLKYIIVVTEFLSHFNFAAVAFKINDWWWIPIYYLIIYLALRKIKDEEKT